jgi:hypothetical protein
VGAGAAGLGGLVGTLHGEPLWRSLRVCAGRAQRLVPGADCQLPARLGGRNARGKPAADARKPGITADTAAPVNKSRVSSRVCQGLTPFEILWITRLSVASGPYNPAARKEVFHNEPRRT